MNTLNLHILWANDLEKHLTDLVEEAKKKYVGKKLRYTLYNYTVEPVEKVKKDAVITDIYGEYSFIGEAGDLYLNIYFSVEGKRDSIKAGPEVEILEDE